MSNPLEQTVQTLQQKLSELELNQLSVSVDKVADASSFRKAKYQCDIEQSITISGELKKDQKSALQPITELVKELQTNLENSGDSKTKIENKISCNIKIGDTFNPIDNVFDFEGNETTVEHTEGQVMLIDFWATWCGPCQLPMQHNQDMLTKNADKWDDNVKIVGFGMDEGVDALKKRVTDKNWDKVIHYHMKGGFKHPTASTEYAIKGIPHVALFDKQGVLLYKGHPSKANLEEWITCLVEDREYVQRKQKIIGDKFDSIENCTDLEGNKQTLAHNEGQVLVIDFWATWCGPCQKPMQHNQDMLVKNEKEWNDKIRIVGLSMDDTLKAAKDRVTERKWDKVEHYQIEGGFKNEVASTDYKVEGIPNIVIFGKDGKLLYQGHPSSIPLEENLTQLANDEEAKFPSKEGEDQGDQTGNNDELKDTSELFKQLSSVSESGCPLSALEDNKKPWFILTDSVKYFSDGTHKQSLNFMRRQPAPNDESSKNFVGIIAKLASDQAITIKDV